jgi:hypothetical protein
MLFVALKDETKKGFYYFCIALFFLDLTFNIYTQLFGVSIYGAPLEIRHGDLIGRSGGVLGHSFYSIYISLIALFCGIFFKNKFIVLFAVVNILLSGSQRGTVSLVLIAILYLLFYLKVNRAVIYAILVGYIMAIFFGVAYLVNINAELTSHNVRILSWQYGIDFITSNLGNFNSYIRLQPEVISPHLEWEINLKKDFAETLYQFNAEGYYLSEMVNYGLIVGLISIFIFYFFYKLNLNKIRTKSGKEYLPMVLFSGFVFLDSFYSYSIASTLTTFFYSVFASKKPDDDQYSEAR